MTAQPIYPSRETDPPRTDIDTLAALRREIIARGWTRKATARVTAELLANLALALAGIWVFVAYDAVWIRICALIVSTAGSTGVATNTHTSSHYATSGRRWVNELLTYLGYPLFFALSACHWWHKHIVLHHPNPNVVGLDEDIDLGPFFARTRDEVERSRGLLAWYYRHLQWIVFPFTPVLIGFNMQRSGWITLIRCLRRRETRTARHWTDLGFMLLHYVVWLALPLMFFPPAAVFGFYVLRVALMGLAMFAVLAPGHLPLEAVCVDARGEHSDFALLQTSASINFRTGPLGRLFCSGLEYQIEHHLFPNLSHVYYPQVAVLVSDFCRRNGLPYRSYGWEMALWKSLIMFRTPSEVRPGAAHAGGRIAGDGSSLMRVCPGWGRQDRGMSDFSRD